MFAIDYVLQNFTENINSPEKIKRKIDSERIFPLKKSKIEYDEAMDSWLSSSSTPPSTPEKKCRRRKFIPSFVHHAILPYSTYSRPSQFEKIGNYENLDEIVAALEAKRKAERIAREIKTNFPPIDHTSLPCYTRPENFDRMENVRVLEDIAARLAKRRMKKDVQKTAILAGSPIQITSRGQRFIGEDGRPRIRITFCK